ncbi:hypothetical protein BIV57_18750 [Mangrovactinospora gilvigrisea]|uniref:Uncharacterized protein n=2 Tax=Mangrovactinospora gilvigrisea TaxID=1428644 RepID=A0A1J7C323_9ACTN|nr:hypothetical protein BIV57_18750 [Mangrovactinospora gilvigrisea]
MRVVAEWQQEVITAFRARDWAALGYERWESYLDGEFGSHRVQLPRGQRQRIVEAMAEAGMSTRAIGAAVGAHHSTIERDVHMSGGGNAPRAITGIDGKPYEAYGGKPEFGSPVSDEQLKAEALAMLMPPGTERSETDTVGAEFGIEVRLADIPGVPEPKPHPPRRRPLPDEIEEAVREELRVAQRKDRIAGDKRLATHCAAVHHQLPELLAGLGSSTKFLAAADLPHADTPPESRRWWAETLRALAEDLGQVADAIDKELDQ